MNLQLTNTKTKQVLAKEVRVAHSLFKRTKGLLGESSVSSSEALWIKPCSSIHTCFMKFPIDVIFVNKKLEIQCYYENIQPWKILTVFSKVLNPLLWIFYPPTYNIRLLFKSYSVFEFKAHTLSQYQLNTGDILHVGY